jgi:hypothetical protein
MNTIHRLLLAAAMLGAAHVAGAQPWTQHQLILPPAEAGLTGDVMGGFGRTVALSDHWLAVAAPAAPCPASLFGAVLMYQRQRDNTYRFVQKLCNVGPGDAIAIDGDTMVVGWTYHDNTPGDQLHNGRISILNWQSKLRQWRLQTTRDGAPDGLLGSAVGLRNGLLVAGESGYLDGRGRIRSWRRTANLAWVEETPIETEQPLFPIRPGTAERFGSILDIDYEGCIASTCSDTPDALATVGHSGVWIAERTATGWATPILKRPLRGTRPAFTGIAINKSLVVTTSQIFGDDPAAPCNAPYWRTEIHLFARAPGSLALRDLGLLCRDQMDFGPTQQFVYGIALEPTGTGFHFSFPDVPATAVGVVSSWALNSQFRPVMQDAIEDPDLTSLYYADTGNPIYNPVLAGDFFGRGLAAHGDHMAIGAPIYNGLLSVYGAGYVVIYRR